MSSCCNRKNITVPEAQRNIVKAVRNSNPNKSNRSPAGTIARTCPNCYTKTVTMVCPVCGTKIDR